MTDASVPIVLVAGYLSAGKTIWINARIRRGLTSRALLLVNDFGAIDIDAELIEYCEDRLIGLGNRDDGRSQPAEYRS